MWITRTAVLTALLVTVQLATAPLGNQYVTGSAGNLIMVIALLTCGPATGLTVAILSPAFASLAGVGPAFPPLIPFIALGNAAFIAAWHLLGLLNKPGKPGKHEEPGESGNSGKPGTSFVTGISYKSNKADKRVKHDKPGLRHILVSYIIAIVAAVIKFLVLYAGIVKIAIPLILSLNEKQGAMLTIAFSYPQIVTAAIGGALALTIVPPIKKAMKNR